MGEYRVQELAQDVAQVKEMSQGIRADSGQITERHWQRIDGLFARLASACDTQRSELAELGSSLNEEVAGGGAAALLEPATRSRHGQLIADIDTLQRRSRNYLDELKEKLAEIAEINRPELAIEGPTAPPIPPPRTPNSLEDPEETSR